MYQRQLFKKAVTCLVEGYPLIVFGMEYRFYQKGETITYQNQESKMMVSGIFRKCDIADKNNKQTVQNNRWIRYCNLEDIDMLFDGMPAWEQKHLLTQIKAVMALAGEPHFTSCGMPITVSGGIS